MVLWPPLELLAGLHESRTRNNPGGLLCRARQFFNEPLVSNNGYARLTIESAPKADVCFIDGRKRKLSNDESLVGLVAIDAK